MRRSRLTRRAWLPLLVAASLGFFTCLVEARPGGGDSYHGSSSSRSSSSSSRSSSSSSSSRSSSSHSSGSRSSGGGGGDDIASGLMLELLLLCFRYPPLGLTLLAGVVGYGLFKRSRDRKLTDWSVGGVPERRVVASPALAARTTLAGLRDSDPAFSLVLFEDFAYALYAELEVSRARGAIGRLAAFLSPNVAQLLHDPGLERVDGIVIGALRYLDAKIDTERAHAHLELEANFTEVRQGVPQRYYVVDRLVLVRARTARSRAPARVSKLDCPNCGAPLEGMRGTTCGYCRTEVGGGRLDWQIESIERVTTEGRPPGVTAETPERGNQLATLVAPGAEARLAELQQRDPANDPAALWARIALVFNELQVGWSNRDLSRIRPFVSDRLFQYFGYWVDVYLQSRARNVTENARILNIELADVLSDAVYDAVTVRIFATGLDYTLADDGRHLRGSRKQERPYSEYWTLIRGSAARGRPRSDPACPSCGAPLRIGMAGHCEYCQARVVSGDFDWVLSRIEQDEAYGG